VYQSGICIFLDIDVFFCQSIEMRLFMTGVLLLAAGCSKPADTLEKQCRAPFPAYWSSASVHPHHLDYNRVIIRKDGSIIWNGQTISPAKLKEYLKLVAAMDVQSLTDLDFESGTPCKAVVQVRAMMEHELNCAGGGVCRFGRPFRLYREPIPPAPRPAQQPPPPPP
jgi:hypothetical protein